MSIKFDSFLQVHGSSDSQPNGQVSESQTYGGMNKHVPSPPMSAPSVHSYQNNGQKVPANKQKEAMRVKVPPLRQRS